MRAALYALLLAVGTALLIPGCGIVDPDKCGKTRREQTLDLSIYPIGTVALETHDGEQLPVPGGFPVTLKMYKVHCGGSLSGVLLYDYVTSDDGTGRLEKQGLGNWSISVNNEQDQLLVDFYANNSATQTDSRRVAVGYAPLTSSGGVYPTFTLSFTDTLGSRGYVTAWSEAYR